MTKKSKIVLGVAGGCLVLPVLAFTAWYFFFFSRQVILWNYPAADGDLRLTREAARALPLIKAIDRYRGEHSSLPANMADLDPYLPAPSKPPKAPLPSVQAVKPDWHYTRIGDARYDLAVGLGWDPSLHYRFEGSKGYWYFDPGDGSDVKIIKLNPRAG
jgi:hypothetical protein